jgi:O-antigen ligase
MGFVLSVLYFVVNYLTPPVLFGPLAVARVELILALLILLVSLPKLTGSYIFKTPQSVALIGLIFAIVCSVLVGQHWLGGAIQAFLGVIPSIYAYFLICLHCNSKAKFRVLVLMLLFVCLFVIANGYIDLLHGVPGSSPSLSASTENINLNIWNMQHPYLLLTTNLSGEQVYRLRGLGIINDPNDFGQLLVCVIPLIFIFWRAKKTFKNIVFVALPVCALLYGVYLTHSRGALLALLAVVIMAARRRTGTLPALLIAGVLFFAAMAMNFTGGRDISVSAGSDRTVLWGEGLQMLKSHPLFGVGPGGFVDNCGCGHTAHNSLVICAAELGIFGLFFWCLFLFSTARDALAVASPENVSEAVPAMPKDESLSQGIRKIEEIDKAEINRLGRLMVLSLTGFLVAGWFLSRAFVMTFFLLGGMVEVAYEMALQRGMIAPRMRLSRVLMYTGGLAVSLIILMYIMLRTVNLMH